MTGLDAIRRNRPQPGWRGISLMVMLTCLAACTTSADSTPVTPYTPGTYRLGAGDQVRVLTYGDEQLSQDFIVGEEGDLAMPLLGNVAARGLTTTQLSASIAGELKQRGLLRSPSVAVEITAHRPVFILGEVNKPGEYPYQEGMTMLSLTAVAGGFTYRATQNTASVVRPGEGHVETGRLRPQDYVKPGDVIKINERFF